MKTYYFKLIRKPFTYPLVLKRICFKWEDVILEFPDAILIERVGHA